MEDKYYLYHKTKQICFFTLDKQNITSCIINKANINYLPIPLKRILHNKDEFVSIENDKSIILNDEGLILLDCWLSDREIPVNRDNYNKYIKKNNNALLWMLENYAYSLIDCYWINNENNTINYDEILLLKDNIDNYISVITNDNHYYKGINSTLGGQLEKFWYKSNGRVKLCKKVEKPFDVINAREVIASLIYTKQGFRNFCNYEFVKDKVDEVIGCKCFAFTNENNELITAYDLLEEYNLTQQDNVYELIPKLAAKLGADKTEVEKQMDLESIVDFLILNRDRHQGNIGFLRNSNTLKIQSIAPIYDSGSCKHLEGVYPEDLLNTTINGLYNTEQELLSHIRDFSVLDVSKLPSIEEIKSIYNECIYLSEKRKQKLLGYYEERIKFIKNKQLEQSYSDYDIIL